MLKAYAITILIGCLLALMVWSDVWSILSNSLAFYIALVLVLGALIAAFVVLGNPFTGTKDNDEQGD